MSDRLRVGKRIGLLAGCLAMLVAAGVESPAAPGAQGGETRQGEFLILTAPQVGGPPVLMGWTVNTVPLTSKFLGDPTFDGGVTIATGDVNGDGARGACHRSTFSPARASRSASSTRSTSVSGAG